MQGKVLRNAAFLACAAAILFSAAPARANLTDAQRKALAESFVGKLKSFYKKVEEEEKKEDDTFASIPDGQELLLQPYLKGLPFSDNVYGTKKNGKAFLSFQNFVDVLYFPITYDEKTRKASGWFLREDWPFSLDYDAKQVTARGKTYSITDSIVYIDGEDLYVSTDALQTWFGIGIEPNLMAQSLLLTSDYPFPVQSHKRRMEKPDSDRRNLNVAQYPLMETDYKWLDVKSAQVSASTSLRRSPETPQTRRSTANVVAQGQALKHSFYSTVNYDDTQKINSATGRLFRESLEPTLLGPLKARAYYIGDIDQTTIPLTPSSSSDFGVSVSNTPLYDRYDLSATVIRGAATPGWDVELYRNGGLIDTISVGDDGRYAFDDVQLFAGDNDFELLFYGPQGEIRRETLNLPVSQEVIEQKDNTYEFSAAAQETQTYRKIPVEDDDKGAAHVAGRYNFLIGEALADVGFRHLSLGGEEKDYLSTGAITTALSTIVDVNAAVDEQGESGASMQLRRDFGEIDASLSGFLASDGFKTSETDDPVVRDIGVALRAPLSFLPGRRNTVFLNSDYSESAQGDAQESHNVSLASQYGSFNVTNALHYQKDGDAEERMSYDPSVSGRFGKFYWRAGADYEMKPEKQLDNMLLDVKYRHNDEWSGDLTVERQPQDNFTQYRLGANWNNEKFVLTPFIDYDTDRELYTGVSMRFGLINPPGEDGVIMTGRNIGGEGFVSAFVYLDKDGDLKFDGDDEPLPGVMVRSYNVSRRETTDENGIALLNSLQANRQTDVNLDPETLPDPFMISKFKPISVAVKPGEIIQLEMPVQYSGELDGTLWLNKRGGIKDVMRGRVALVPLENDDNAVIQSEALSDGMFVFSLIPAGRYFIVVNPDDAARQEAARPAPRLVDIGYDAPVLYGQDIALNQGLKDIGFTVLNEEDALGLGLAPVEDRRKAAPIYLINVGKEKGSKLLNLLFRFNASRIIADNLADLQRAGGDEEESMRFFAPDRSLEGAYARCAQIVGKGMPCSVEAALPPSEKFAVRRKGIVTTDNAEAAKKAEKL